MTQLLIIAAYLLLLLALGVAANRFFRGTTGDYMLASHSIGPVLLLMSLFGTTMTAFAIVGSTGVSFKQGIGIYGELASAAGIVHSACFLLIGVPLWRAGRQQGFRTQIQFFRSRFDSDWIGYVLFPLLVGFVVTYLLLGVVGAGAVINKVSQGAFSEIGWFADNGFGLPRWMASGLICLVVMLYVFFGGMRGTAWANTFQTAVFMILALVTFFAIARSMGGGNPGLFETLKLISESVPEQKRSMAGMNRAVFFSYLLIPLSVGMFPHVFQHWLTARSARVFKLPIVMHPIFVMIVWAPCVLLGVWANSPLAGVPADTHPNEVLATLVTHHTGAVLGGLLTAGILAAIMSSLDSQFLCLGTMFTEDIVHHAAANRLSDRQLVWCARAFVVLIVIVTFVLSLLLPRSVFDLGIWSFTGFTGLFPIVFAALYWRRVTLHGALASIVVTAVLWGWLFYRSGLGANRGYTFPEQPVQWGFLEIPQMAPIATVTAASALTLVLVSLATKPPRREVLKRFGFRHADD